MRHRCVGTPGDRCVGTPVCTGAWAHRVTGAWAHRVAGAWAHRHTELRNHGIVTEQRNLLTSQPDLTPRATAPGGHSPEAGQPTFKLPHGGNPARHFRFLSRRPKQNG